MKFMRSLPLMWARTRWLFSSSMANIALGSGSMTVPSTSIASFLATGGVGLLLSVGGPGRVPGRRPWPARRDAEMRRAARCAHESGLYQVAANAGKRWSVTPLIVRIRGPEAVTARLCSQ